MTLTHAGLRRASGPPKHHASSDGRHDNLLILRVLVILLIGIPSVYVFKPLGAAGTPAGVLGDLLLLLWLFGRVSSGFVPRRRNPIHVLFGVFALALLFSYLAGMLRPISAVEVSGANRALLVLGAWAGALLLVSDGIATRERLDAFLRFLVAAGGIFALVGIVQFFTGFDVVQYLHLPGLTANQVVGELSERSGFRRVAATALHSIEFGAVISMILPLAFHYALRAPKGRRVRAAWPLVAMLAAIPLTVARSAVLGVTVVLVLLMLVWTRRQRLWMMFLGACALPLFLVVTPHLLGTIRSLFLHAGQDSSIQARTDDYTAVGYYATHAPLFGRGASTFLPTLYRTLDNQYLGTLVEAGFIGLTALVVILVGAFLVGIRVRRASSDPETRSLAYSLAVSPAVAAVSMYTFDGFGFPMFSGVLFVLLGALGCLWRLEIGESLVAPHVVRRAHGRLFAAVLSVLTLGVLAIGIHLAGSPRGEYVVLARVPVYGQPPYGGNPLVNSAGPQDVVQQLQRSATSPATRQRLAERGYGTYEVAIGNGSLEHDTDVVGLGSTLTVAATSTSPEGASATAAAVTADISSTLREWQISAGAPPSTLMTVGSSAVASSAYYQDDRPNRAKLCILASGFALWIALVNVSTRRRIVP